MCGKCICAIWPSTSSRSCAASNANNQRDNQSKWAVLAPRAVDSASGLPRQHPISVVRPARPWRLHRQAVAAAAPPTLRWLRVQSRASRLHLASAPSAAAAARAFAADAHYSGPSAAAVPAAGRHSMRGGGRAYSERSFKIHIRLFARSA